MTVETGTENFTTDAAATTEEEISSEPRLPVVQAGWNQRMNRQDANDTR